MKKRHLYILLILLVHTACRNKGRQVYFTGTIEYAYTYSSDSLNTDSLGKSRPAKGIFRYDLDNYQSQFLGKDTNTYYYSGALNKAVSITGQGPGYECEDYALANDSVVSWKLYDTDEKIAGQNCSVLEMQKKNSWVKYFISKEKKIAPGTYLKHKAYNWDVYGEKTAGGLILKMEHRFKYFSMKGTAMAIKDEPAGFKALELEERKFHELCNNTK